MRIKAGDTAPNLLADTNADLTGATAVIRVRELATQTSVIDRACTITDPTNGLVDGGDASTLPVGEYQWHIVVTFAGGEIQSFPQGSYLELIVNEAIPVPAP
jgi:hypothetical protein